MEIMRSLADVLGTSATTSGDEPGGTTSTLNKATKPRSAKAFCEGIINSHEFRQYLLNGITLGDLAPGVVLRIMDYAWGKPVERIEVTSTQNPFDAMAVEQVEARIAFLDEVLQRLRGEDAQKHDDNSQTSSSVH